VNEAENKPERDLSALRIRRGEIQTRPPRRLKRIHVVLLILVVIVIAAALLLFGGYLRPVQEVRVATAVKMAPSQAEAILNASGYVVAQRKAAVASKGTGRLEFLGVEEGDQVKSGDIIARIEHSDMDAALAQSRANLALTKALLEEARAEERDATLTYERMRSLLAENVISQSDYDQADARYKRAIAVISSASAAIEAAEAAVRGAEVGVENTNIRAPFDGTVLTKNADVGEIVAPLGSSANARAAVVTIADMSSLQVEADVSESNIQKIDVEQPCLIVLDAFPEKRYRGVVHKIVPTADRAKATVLTKVRFLDQDERVLPEMSARVQFLSKPAPDSLVSAAPRLVIPASSVVTRDGGKIAFVLVEEVVRETPVETGSPAGGFVEVTQGLTEGDVVVIDPGTGLRDGSRVRISRE
jgi:RND family efflux transporter MFP subunit